MISFMIPKGAVRYTLLPDLMSRFHGLFSGGFHYLPYILALVYQAVRLLPRNHPYFLQENIGRYGVRHVMAEAANNIRFSVRNVDQIILYGIILCGLILMVVQIISIGAFLYVGSAMALPTNWTGFFQVATPAQDLAYIMLDLVFGVPDPSGGGGGFFNSCVGLPIVCQDLRGVNVININLAAAGSTLDPTTFSVTSTNASTVFPFAYHKGLHQLFAVYSQGLLVIAVIMVSYFIATILAETAQTGTPFGRRFNKTWAPLRLVMAFGLLMPLTTGLNSSQYLVLYAAKFGSAFATNGWNYFNSTLSENYLGQANSLVSRPSIPDVTGLLQFFFVANVCKTLYESIEDKAGNQIYHIKPYVHGPENATPNTYPLTSIVSDGNFNDALNMIGTGNNVMIISFGDLNPTKYSKERGHVRPLCGQLRWVIADPRPSGVPLPGGAEPGVAYIQKVYLTALVGNFLNFSGLFSGATTPPETGGSNRRYRNFVMHHAPEILAKDLNDGANAAYIDTEYKRQIEDNVLYNATNYNLNKVFADALALQIGSMSAWPNTFAGIPYPLNQKGWAAAGIWYNTIASLNGNMTMAAVNLPVPYKYPEILEKLASIKAKFTKDVDPLTKFDPQAPGLDDISKYISSENALKFAEVLSKAYKAWDPADSATTHNKLTGSPIMDAISSLVGTNGLYDMRNNPNTHPLAQIVGIGRSLVEAAVRNLGYATIATAGGIAMGDVLGPFAGQLGATAASMFVTISMMALTIGFVLFYVVPFMPFIYFYFAVGGWIKGIFEAMVGAPLWALAHIRIDAHGLPGNAALNGYFLIFEVFLRPILIVFGLLASISTFAALVSVLNSVYPQVTANIAGYDIEKELSGTSFSTIQYMRGKVDQFFFTVIYGVIVYMMGMSSFKLIDLIPNNILRWMGSSVATFNDQREDPAANLASKASLGAQQSLSRIGSGLQSMTRLASPTSR